MTPASPSRLLQRALRGAPGVAALLASAVLASAVLAGAVLAGCGGGEAGGGPSKAARSDTPPVSDTLFTRMPASFTGVAFTNELELTPDLNVFTYRNYYHGGGVAVGDLDGDGRQDLFFTANQGPNKLYLNRGDWWFDDVTTAAGVAGAHAWATGVSLADVNGDGRTDIYVCNSGDMAGDDRANELYINQGSGGDSTGVPTFEEKAAAYGLADEGYGTHAAFFDYDRDGDLDVYLLNNSFAPVSEFDLRSGDLRAERDAEGGDKLYRQDQGPGGALQFVDVSEAAGLYGSEVGFSLGGTVGDVNRDGWPDLYVSNDFFERDYLYLNQQDGTFREVLTEQMPHISLSSMGADMADVSGDGYPELFVTDMLPRADARLKTTTKFNTPNLYQTIVRNGYHHQLTRNTLQLNNGDSTFSEVAALAGVDATDWSWGALLADFDLDGRRDIFVANGAYKDMTNQDFIDYLASEETFRNFKQKGRDGFTDLIEKMPSQKVSNYAFRNLGGLRFENRAEAWGLARPSFSNGSAYGDLDNDGDLDLVVNNLQQESFLYRNEADALTPNRSLQVVLRGRRPNPRGLGTQVTIRHGEADTARTTFLEQQLTRGFQSTVGPVLTAGVGAADTLASVTVAWPDSSAQTFRDVPAGTRLVARQEDATPGAGFGGPPATAKTGQQQAQRFAEVTGRAGLRYEHEENTFVDFNRERLIPKKVSTEGPPLATADVNGDGRDDVYVGGAKGSAGALFVQQPDGEFSEASSDAFAEDRTAEDTGAAFFDADGDGDLDLYVVSGGNAFSPSAPALEDRLYLNDGQGAFASAPRGAVPDDKVSGSVVAPADYDGDGDVDLFVGGRVVPWRYGLDPQSALLENDGTGRFTDATSEAAPDLSDLGMVTTAAWADTDGDGREDLVVAGEWMPIAVFENAGGALRRREEAGLGKSHGWWNRLRAGDFDGDGDVDFIAGNRGENARLRARPERPVRMHVGDVDRNGHVEQIVSHYEGDAAYPLALRGPMLDQLSYLRRKYPTHAGYAGETVEDIFTEEQLARTQVKTTHTFATSYVENNGDGTFSLHALPRRAQLAPVYGLLARDFDGDGALDVLMAGNFHGYPPSLGRMDAGYGLLLRGDGAGGFTPVPARESGFRAGGEARALAMVEAAGAPLVLVAKNDAPMQVFSARPAAAARAGTASTTGP